MIIAFFRSGIESGNGHDIFIDNENENLTKSPYRYIYLNSFYKYFCCIDNNNEDLAKRVYNYIFITEFFCFSLVNKNYKPNDSVKQRSRFVNFIIRCYHLI